MADRYQYHPGAAGARDHDGAHRSSESDPLAELARLIGQTDASFDDEHRPAAPPQAQAHDEDRYQDQHAEPSAAEPAPPSWMRTAATTGWQRATPTIHPVADHDPAPEQSGYSDQRDQHHRDQHYQDQNYQDQSYQDRQYSDAPSFLRTAHQHDQSRYDDVLYDQNSQNVANPQYADQQYADGQYQDGYHEQSDPNAYSHLYANAEEDEPRRRRGGLTTVVAVLALAVVGTAAAYGYRSFTGAPPSGEPPVIKAEPGANKIVPPTQTSDASGKILDRIGGASNGQERVLSREEQPIDINGRNVPRVVFPPLNQTASAQSPFPAVTQPAQPAQEAQQPQQQGQPQQPQPNGALGDEPRRVRTLAIRPDQPDTVPSGSASPPRSTSARAQIPAPSGNTPMSLSPQSGAAPVRTAAAPAAASSPSGGYMVQVSSQRSEADAQASYRAIQSKFPNVLGSHSASIRRADLGERGIYFRALVGPFAAAEEAGQLCSSLKSAGGQCVVQRN
jgi:hypothetical protein